MFLFTGRYLHNFTMGIINIINNIIAKHLKREPRVKQTTRDVSAGQIASRILGVVADSLRGLYDGFPNPGSELLYNMPG